MSPLLCISIWYWADQIWWRINRYFGHILVTFVCQENMEISIWHNSIWKLYRSESLNGRKSGIQTIFSCFSTQEWCAWELPEIALKTGLVQNNNLCIMLSYTCLSIQCCADSLSFMSQQCNELNKNSDMHFLCTYILNWLIALSLQLYLICYQLILSGRVVQTARSGISLYLSSQGDNKHVQQEWSSFLMGT